MSPIYEWEMKKNNMTLLSTLIKSIETKTNHCYLRAWKMWLFINTNFSVWEGGGGGGGGGEGKWNKSQFFSRKRWEERLLGDNETPLKMTRPSGYRSANPPSVEGSIFESGFLTHLLNRAGYSQGETLFINLQLKVRFTAPGTRHFMMEENRTKLKLKEPARYTSEKQNSWQ